MAEISGVNGKVTFSSTGVTTVNSWTLSYAGDTLETTNFDTTGVGRTYIPGLTGWSGSYDGFFSSGNAVVPGDRGDIILTVSTATATKFSWTGGIIITGMDVTTPRDGVVTQGYTFQGTGLLQTSTS